MERPGRPIAELYHRSKRISRKYKTKVSYMESSQCCKREGGKSWLKAPTFETGKPGSISVELCRQKSSGNPVLMFSETRVYLDEDWASLW